jgi:hypothetical protein
MTVDTTPLDGFGGSVWDGVVGQPVAVAQLQASAESPLHAYLFVGPPGSTKNEAARAFAALILAGRDDPHQRDILTYANSLASARRSPARRLTRSSASPLSLRTRARARC